MRLFSTPLLILVLILTAAPVFAQQTLQCDMCGQRIQGTYNVFNNAEGKSFNICQNCATFYPRCAMCGLPTRHGYNVGDKVVCPDCAQNVRTCGVCGKLILGRHTYYELDNGQRHDVCNECMKSAHRCVSCGVPHKPSNLWRYPNGDLWCAQCLKKARVCSTCQMPIAGEYYTLKHKEGVWCEDCYKHLEKCDTCKAPMRQAARRLADGRKICPQCESTAISGTRNVTAIAAKIRPDFERLLGRELEPVPIRAVSLQELRQAIAQAELLPGARDHAHGNDDMVSELGLCRSVNGSTEILVLDHLPMDLMWETVAHEMAHAWQHRYYPQCDELILVEGFAQWVAEKMCLRHNRTTTLEQLREQRGVYGDGYRLMARIESRRGIQGVLNALATNDKSGR